MIFKSILNNVHVWGVWWTVEVFKLRRVFLKPLCSNFESVGCGIVLLELSKSVGMHNGHEWMQMISQDAYVCATCQSRIRSPISLQQHTPHTITELPPA